jgi:hypothetical protein
MAAWRKSEDSHPRRRSEIALFSRSLAASWAVMPRRSLPLLRVLLVAPVLVLGCSGSSSLEGPAGESAAADTTFPNDRAAYEFFVGKGLSGPQAAGIVGNFDVESGDDPTAVESGGGGRGLAQWLAGGRWDTTSGDNAAAYAKQQGESLESLQLQLEFTWFELTTFPDYGLARLKAATTVSAATTAFTSGFEGCSTCDETARIADAQAVLDAFGNETVGDGGPGDDDDDAAIACVVTSDDGAADRDGVCLDTSACAALGAHVSTPGFCPGAANIECCTATGTASDGGAAASDAGAVHPTDASASGGGTGGVDGSGEPATDSASDGGGCSLSGIRARNGLDPSWLAGLGLSVLAFRRRRPGKFSPL